MPANKKTKSKPAKRKTKPASNGKHPGGRPPLFDDPNKMQTSIDEYFDNPPKETFHIDGKLQSISL